MIDESTKPLNESDKDIILQALPFVLGSSAPSVSVEQPPSYAALLFAVLKGSCEFSVESFKQAQKECKILALLLHPDKHAATPDYVANATQWFQALRNVQDWCKVFEKQISERHWLKSECGELRDRMASARHDELMVEQDFQALLRVVREVASYATVCALADQIFCRLEQQQTVCAEMMKQIRSAFEERRHQWALTQWPRRLCENHEEQRAFRFAVLCCADLSHILAWMFVSPGTPLDLQHCLPPLRTETFVKDISPDCPLCHRVLAVANAASSDERALERLRRHPELPFDCIFTSNLVRCLVGKFTRSSPSIWSAILTRERENRGENVNALLAPYRRQRATWWTTWPSTMKIRFDSNVQYAKNEVGLLMEFVDDQRASMVWRLAQMADGLVVAPLTSAPSSVAVAVSAPFHFSCESDSNPLPHNHTPDRQSHHQSNHTLNGQSDHQSNRRPNQQSDHQSNHTFNWQSDHQSNRRSNQQSDHQSNHRDLQSDRKSNHRSDHWRLKAKQPSLSVSVACANSKDHCDATTKMALENQSKKRSLKSRKDDTVLEDKEAPPAKRMKRSEANDISSARDRADDEQTSRNRRTSPGERKTAKSPKKRTPQRAAEAKNGKTDECKAPSKKCCGDQKAEPTFCAPKIDEFNLNGRERSPSVSGQSLLSDRFSR